MDDKFSQMKRWLKCLCEKFSVEDSPIVDIAKCLDEINECNSKNLFTGTSQTSAFKNTNNP